MVPAVTELCYPHPAHSWTRRLAIYPRLRPPQRGQTKPFGQRCAVRCSPHRTSSPKRERNSLTVMMDFRFNGLDFFISDILSPFVRLFKLDIHLEEITVTALNHALDKNDVGNLTNFFPFFVRRENRLVAAIEQFTWIIAVEEGHRGAIDELVVGTVVNQYNPVGCHNRRRAGFNNAGVKLSRTAWQHRSFRGLGPMDKVD